MLYKAVGELPQGEFFHKKSSAKVRIFTSATTHEMCGYLKKNPDNIILHIGSNNSVN